jgi:hypothetical protein
MTVESASYIEQLNSSLPSSTDYRHEGDNHLRLIKQALKNTFKSSNKQYDLDAIAGRGVPVGAILMWSGDTEGSIPDGWVLCDGRDFTRSDNGQTQTTPDLRDRFIVSVGYTDPMKPVNETGGTLSREVTVSSAGAHNHGMENGGKSGWAGAHNHGGGTGMYALTINELPPHDHGRGGHAHVSPYRGFAVSYNRAVPNDMPSNGEGSLFYRMDGPYTRTSNPPNTADENWILKNETAGQFAVSMQGGGGGHNHSISYSSDHTHDLPMTSGVGGHTHSFTDDRLPPYYTLAFIMKT